MSEEVELIVESLLGVLMRTILEISNRPQSAGPAMRLQFQDVTVSATPCALLMSIIIITEHRTDEILMNHYYCMMIKA